MYLKKSNKIIIKIGSSLLIDNEKNIREKWLIEFSKDIKNLLIQNNSTPNVKISTSKYK